MTSLIDELDALAEKATGRLGGTAEQCIRWNEKLEHEAGMHWPEISARLRAAEKVCAAAGAGIADVHYSIDHNTWPDRADQTLRRLEQAFEAWHRLAKPGEGKS